MQRIIKIKEPAEHIEEIESLAGDILHSERFAKAGTVRHHYTTSVARHSLAVAAQAYEIAEWFTRHGMKVNVRDVVRGSLLHDLGMTEDYIFFSVPPIKAYTHPRQSVLIAEKEFKANEIQLNAIRRHMWPICLIPPGHLEGWVVLFADKLCAYREVKGKNTADQKGR